MSTLEFCPGHLLGRISNLQGTQKRLHALFDIFNMQIRNVNDFEEDEEVLTLLGLMRIGRHLCEDFEESLIELQEIADDGLHKEASNKKEA